MHFTKKTNKINERNTVYYGTSSLEWVVEFKYLGIIIAQNNNFGRALDHLCQQSKRAQTVLDLHIHRHPTLSVDHIMRLFVILIRPILTFDCEIWGVGNYDVIEKLYLNFVKKLLGVKPNTNTAMLYAELGSFPLSIYIRKTLKKYWLKIMNSGHHSLPGIVYYNMFNSSEQNWATTIKQILFETGYGFVWLNQNISNEKLFLNQFEERCKDMHMQQCVHDIENSGRCRIYKEIKQSYKLELYLKCNIRSSLRIYLARFRLSSHRFLIERGRWMKPKIELPNRICTFCNDKDIQDEYHIVPKCVHFHILRIKFINKYYYVRPSMYKFQQLMNTRKKREYFRLMLFVKLTMNEYNSML